MDLPERHDVPQRVASLAEVVTELALAPQGPRGVFGIEDALREAGWSLTSAESMGSRTEHRWSWGEGPPSSLPSPTVWLARGSGEGEAFALIVAANTDDDVEGLRIVITNVVERTPTFDVVESDDYWASWSDGTRDVHVAVHRASSLFGQDVTPTVQLSIESPPTRVGVER